MLPRLATLRQATDSAAGWDGMDNGMNWEEWGELGVSWTSGVHGINRCWTRQPCEVAAPAHQVVRKVRYMADSSTFLIWAELSQAMLAMPATLAMLLIWARDSIHYRIRSPMEIRELLHEWKLHLSPQRTSTGM